MSDSFGAVFLAGNRIIPPSEKAFQPQTAQRKIAETSQKAQANINSLQTKIGNEKIDGVGKVTSS